MLLRWTGPSWEGSRASCKAMTACRKMRLSSQDWECWHEVVKNKCENPCDRNPKVSWWWKGNPIKVRRALRGSWRVNLMGSRGWQEVFFMTSGEWRGSSQERAPRPHVHPLRQRRLDGRWNVPYWKPTQVGKCESTQVSNEGTLRNSAKSPRKFARRGAHRERSRWAAGNRGVRLFNKNTSLRKVERQAMWADACPVLETGQRMSRHPMEGRANGCGNLDRTKVA